ncbi:hypothetical protein [Candidatus Poriferisodalis sp.]|uniref:hypothetical protein n=1 Tax=Candidatus Poriferisodalis sp. TaxID=3101277 RepID=UPI003B018E0B
MPALDPRSPTTGPECNVRARDLPALIADYDGRARLVGIRQFCKDWAASDHPMRLEMIAAAPRRVHWWHRFGARRFDMRRIAAVVDALCDRDGVPAPTWAQPARRRRAISLTEPQFPSTPWNDYERSEAPPACARHDVWFRPVDIEDHRVHGFS